PVARGGGRSDAISVAWGARGGASLAAHERGDEMKDDARRLLGIAAVATSIVAAGYTLGAQAPPADDAPAAPATAAGRGGAGGGQAQGGPGKADPINAWVDSPKNPSLQPQVPGDELKQFILQPGYRLELVLSDPDIDQPAAIAFDGNGRMFVL